MHNCAHQPNFGFIPPKVAGEFVFSYKDKFYLEGVF